MAGIAASTPRLGLSVAGTPLRTPGGGVAAPTPTPLRDALGLNDRYAAVPAETARLERARQAAARSELRDQCASVRDAMRRCPASHTHHSGV